MTNKKITIIDYGLGNILNLKRAFEFLGASVIITNEHKKISKSSSIVLPGVGAFPNAMQSINALQLKETLVSVAKKEIPFLGICLGMQLLFTESKEFSLTKGLGLIPGKVIEIPNSSKDGNKIKVPHMGWNSLALSEGVSSWKGSVLQENFPQEEVYFTHSYMGVPSNNNNRLADCIYGGHRISAVVKNKNIIGCQFHPEKSGKSGLEILKQFIKQ
jgi:glutamine amidotransferase